MRIQRRQRKWRSHCWSQCQFQEVGEGPAVSVSSERGPAEYMCCYWQSHREDWYLHDAVIWLLVNRMLKVIYTVSSDSYRCLLPAWSWLIVCWISFNSASQPALYTTSLTLSMMSPHTATSVWRHCREDRNGPTSSRFSSTRGTVWRDSVTRLANGSTWSNLTTLYSSSRWKCWRIYYDSLEFMCVPPMMSPW